MGVLLLLGLAADAGLPSPAELSVPRLLSSSGALNQPLFVQRPAPAIAAQVGTSPGPRWGTELEMYTLQYIPGPVYVYGLYCALSADGGASFGPSTLVLRLPNASSAVALPDPSDSLIYLSPPTAAVDLPRRMLHMIILTTSEHSEYSVAVAYTAATHWPPSAGKMPEFTSGVLSQALPRGTSVKTGAAPRNLILLRGSGRLVFPWFYANGQNYSGADLFNTTAVYCDDCGSLPAARSAFYRSETQITVPTRAPCESCDGAIEPTIAELPNGTLYMLIRTQTGSLWQSSSGDRAVRWSAPTPTHFVSSDSPPCLTRLPDDRLLLVWNNALKAFPNPNRSDYPSRQILHGALGTCTDAGCEWSGFREVRRDRLLRSAAAHHDYGTAYPYVSTYTPTRCTDLRINGEPWHDGGGAKYDCAWYRTHSRCDNGSVPGDTWANHTSSSACCHCPGGGEVTALGTGIIGTSGQGLFRTDVFAIPDVNWLTQDTHADFTEPTLASGWNSTADFERFVVSCTGDFFQRPRPCESSTALLHGSGPGNCGVGPPLALAVGGDTGVNGGGGITWNFAAQKTGTLTLELSCEPNFGGAVLSLTDFFASPSECQQTEDFRHANVGCEIAQLDIERHGLFALPLSAGKGADAGLALKAGTWTNVTLRWDLDRAACEVSTSDGGSQSLPLLPRLPDRVYSGHVSYLRLRTVGCGFRCNYGKLLVRRLSATAPQQLPAPPLQESDAVGHESVNRLEEGDYAGPSAKISAESKLRLAECEGERLYNGICLPKAWPPPTPDIDFCKDVEAAWSPHDPPYLADPPAVIDISIGRQLFVDAFLIDTLTDAEIEYFNASWIGPVITPDRAWELNPASPYPASPYSKAFSGGVWFNPLSQEFQAWYNCGWGGGVCYATSADGLAFDKPAIGIVKNAPIGVEGWNVSVSGDSNIILMNDPSRLSWGGTWDSHVTIDGSCVWMDLDDPDRCSRYKLMTVGAHGLAGSQYAFWASPDGVNFTLVVNSSTTIGDRSSFFFNPFRKKVKCSSENTLVMLSRFVCCPSC